MKSKLLIGSTIASAVLVGGVSSAFAQTNELPLVKDNLSFEQMKHDGNHNFKHKFSKHFPGPKGGKRMGIHGRMLPPQDMLEISATILGITPDQLKQEFQNHKPLPELVKAHGLTMEEFKQKTIEIMKERIQSGKVTGKLVDRYNKIIEKLTNFKPKTN